MRMQGVAITKTKQVPFLPAIEAVNHNRIVTKHFCNVCMYLKHEESSMLHWLVYRSAADNTFNYSMNLLRAYEKSIIESNKLYNESNARRRINGLRTSVFYLRNTIIDLIEKGYLFWVMDDKLIINPMLCYYEYLSAKEYSQFCRDYNTRTDVTDVQILMIQYMQMVKNKM